MRCPTWPNLCLRLALALFLQSAFGFLLPGACPKPVAQPYDRCWAASSGIRAHVHARRPPPLLLSLGFPVRRTQCSRLSSLLASAAATAAANSFLRGDVAQRRARSASTTTTLALGSDNGLQDDGSDVAGGGEGKDGWRQRMVRTIVTVFLRMRAVVAALGSRLGLGRSSKVRNIAAQTAALKLETCVASSPKLQAQGCCVRKDEGQLTGRHNSTRSSCTSAVHMSTCAIILILIAFVAGDGTMEAEVLWLAVVDDRVWRARV